MAIAPKGRSSSTAFASPIDDAWRQVREALERYDGRAAAGLVRAEATQRPAVFVALLNRFEGWLQDWFRARGFGQDANHPGEDFTAEAVVSWRLSVAPTADVWTVSAIPVLVADLERLAGTAPAPAAFAPSAAAVRSEIRSAVPGRLFREPYRDGDDLEDDR
jgi:hypothetical protein